MARFFIMRQDNHCVKCQRFSYFSLPNGVCSACREKKAKYDAVKKRYANREWSIMDVIYLRWRLGFSRHQIADILQSDFETIDRCIEIAKQNAK